MNFRKPLVALLHNALSKENSGCPEQLNEL
jgi:hypothetical protein